MKKVLCLLMIIALGAAYYHQRNQRVKRGDLVLLDKVGNAKPSHGSVEIDKVNKTISWKTYDGQPFASWVVLWEAEIGRVMRQRTAYFKGSDLTYSQQLTDADYYYSLYRSYFPPRQ